MGDGAEPLLHETRDVGDDAVGDRPVEIGRIAAVDADDDDGPGRPAVTNPIEFDALCAHRLPPLADVASWPPWHAAGAFGLM